MRRFAPLYLRPGWVLPRGGLAGGGVALAILYGLKLHNPTGRVSTATATD